MTDLRKLLIKHEGLRLKPYVDTVGKLTIGIGRNLDDNGISEDEANLMFANDLRRIIVEATEAFTWFKFLSRTRQDVVLNMIFNMGIKRFGGFIKFIDALSSGAFDKAADEMLNSRWSGQVGIRADELSNMMRVDRYV